MTGIYFCKYNNNKSGFTNQIFSLVTSIILAYKSNCKVVVLESMQRDYDNINMTIESSRVFYLEYINK